VPLNAVVAIYARETGAGTVLGPEPAEGEENPLSVAESPESPEDDPPPEGGGKPTLRVVK
jgi:stringent starvation protein B